MTDSQLIELSKKLIAIPSTGDNPDKLQEAYQYMKQFVRRLDPTVTIEEFLSNGKPSFLAYKGSKRPERFSVILNGHLDVIAGKPSQYKAQIDGDKLYGRGTHDMKAACIVMADIFCEFVHQVPYALGLQIVTDEETGGFDGASYQVSQGVRADFAICGECGRATNKHEIANEAKGIVFADIAFTGKTAHGAYPWRGDNAAMRANRFVHALHERFPTPNDESHETTITVTGISAVAEVTNKIPEHAVVTIDARFVPGDPHFLTENDFATFIKSFDPDAKIAAMPVFTPPMYADPNGSFMVNLQKAAEEVEGTPFRFVMRHAGSDARHFVVAGGQACEFGIAGEDQHGDNEHITLEAFSNYRKTMRHFLNKTIKAEESSLVTIEADKKLIPA